jgi:hypothetical protein
MKSKAKTFRLATKPNNVFTANELAEMLNIGKFHDGTLAADSLAEANWEYIEDAAFYAAAREDDRFTFDSRDHVKKVCTRCDGLGYVECDSAEDDDCDEDDCSECDGDGYVDLSVEDDELLRDSKAYWDKKTEMETDLYEYWQSAFEDTLETYGDHFDAIFVRCLITGDGKNEPYHQDGYIFKPAPDKTWRDVALELIETINGYGMFWYEDGPEFLSVGPYGSYKEAVCSHLHWMKYYGEVYGGYSASRVYDDNLEAALRYW